MQNETKVCKHCQTEIPKKAKVCPNCRKKQGGIFKWIVIVIVAIAVIGAFTGGDDEPKKVGDAQSEKQETEEKKDTFSLGEIAELDGVNKVFVGRHLAAHDVYRPLKVLLRHIGIH